VLSEPQGEAQTDWRRALCLLLQLPLLVVLSLHFRVALLRRYETRLAKCSPVFCISSEGCFAVDARSHFLHTSLELDYDSSYAEIAE
jgi:hypothetical protein